MQTVNCFLPYFAPAQVMPVINELKSTGWVNKIYLMTSNPEAEKLTGCEILLIDTLTSSQTLYAIYKHADGRNILFYTKYSLLKLGQYGLERMIAASVRMPLPIV